MFLQTVFWGVWVKYISVSCLDNTFENIPNFIIVILYVRSPYDHHFSRIFNIYNWFEG